MDKHWNDCPVKYRKKVVRSGFGRGVLFAIPMLAALWGVAILLWVWLK